MYGRQLSSETHLVDGKMHGIEKILECAREARERLSEVLGQRCARDKEAVLAAARKDPSLPPFRERDNRAKRSLPPHRCEPRSTVLGVAAAQSTATTARRHRRVTSGRGAGARCGRRPRARSERAAAAQRTAGGPRRRSATAAPRTRRPAAAGTARDGRGRSRARVRSRRRGDSVRPGRTRATRPPPAPPDRWGRTGRRTPPSDRSRGGGSCMRSTARRRSPATIRA